MSQVNDEFRNLSGMQKAAIFCWRLVENIRRSCSPRWTSKRYVISPSPWQSSERSMPTLSNAFSWNLPISCRPLAV